MDRNSLSEEEAMKKISSQMPINLKIKKADIKIENDGTLNELEKRVINKIIP